MADEFTAADFAPSEAEEFTAADFAPTPVVRSAPAGSLQAHHLLPAVRLIAGDVVTGEQGDTHPDIITDNAISATDIDQRGFSGPLGFMDRESAAAALNAPTAFEPGRLHSTDLSTLQEPGGYEKQLQKVAQAEEAPEPLLKLPELPEAVRKYYALPPRLIAGERGGQITEGAVQALYDAAKSLPEFFTTEEGVLSALAGLTPLGRSGVTAYFTYDMAKSLLDQAGAAGAEWDNLNAAEKAAKITQAAVTLGFVGMLASAGVGQAKGAVKTAADLLKQPPETAPPTERPGGAPPTAPAEVKAEVGEVPKAAPTEPAIATVTAPEPERQAPVVAAEPTVTREISYDAETHDRAQANVEERLKGKPRPSRSELFRLYDEEYNRLVAEKVPAPPPAAPAEPAPAPEAVKVRKLPNGSWQVGPDIGMEFRSEKAAREAARLPIAERWTAYHQQFELPSQGPSERIIRTKLVHNQPLTVEEQRFVDAIKERGEDESTRRRVRAGQTVSGVVEGEIRRPLVQGVETQPTPEAGPAIQPTVGAPAPKAPEPAAPETTPTPYANIPRTTRPELPKPVLPELQSPEDFMAKEIQKLAITKPEDVARYKPKGPAFDLSGWTDSAKREAEGIRDIFTYVPEGTDKFVVEFPSGTLPENAVSSLVEAIKQGDGPGTGWLPLSQSDAIRDAFKGGRPVLAESADAHGIRPPAGYVKEAGIYRRMDRPTKGARTGAAQVPTRVAAPEPAAPAAEAPKAPAAGGKAVPVWKVSYTDLETRAARRPFFKLSVEVEAPTRKQAIEMVQGYHGNAAKYGEFRASKAPEGTKPMSMFRWQEPAVEAPKPPAPAAPQTAAAKVENEIAKVARTEGQRPAKEVKSELVQKLEKAIQDAPEAKDLPEGKEAPKVTIDIPGDGIFTVFQTKENITELLKRAKAIKTSPTKLYKETIPAAGIPADVWLQSSEPTHQIEVIFQGAKARIPAKPITLKNKAAQGFQFFLTSDGDEFGIREASTGRLVSTPQKTISKALSVAEESMGDLAKRVQESIEKDGKRAEPIPISKTTPPPPPSMAGPGMVGMGAETAEEFLPAATTATSIKNSVVDQERARRGLPPAFEPIRRSFGEVWDRAMSLIDRDPSYQDRLIKELQAKPRALTDIEDAALLHRQVDLQNEYGKATRDLAQSYADGRTEAVEADKARVAALSDALLDLYNVGKTSGTETGRGLNARKMMANEDFTLASMEMQSRAAKGGRPLTDAEREQLVVLERQIAATQKAYDDYVATATERQRKLEADLALARTKAEAAAEPKYAPRVIQLAEKFATFMDSRANEALARLKARRAQPGAMSGPLNPADLDDLAIVGAAKITRGAFELAKWSDAMLRDVGEWVRPHLQAVWDAANKVFALETSKLERQEGKAIAGAVKKKAAAPTPKDEIGKLGDQIRDKVEKKELDKINWYVRKLARVFYQQGITEREAMVDALHDVLKDILPDWTRRQTADAFSGYGDFKPLSKDAITVALRGMKGELQQLAKLEDMAAGQPPLKSGLERRTPTEVERQLIKRVNDAKYKFQIPVQDPSTQLKSALDTMKTSLRNRITDYEDRLARRDFTPRPRRKIELDPEATRLKAQAERTKDKFREALIADRLANRTKWEKALDWGTKYRRFGVLSSIRVIPKLLSAGLQRLASMPLEELAGSAWELLPAVRGVAEKAPLEGGGRNWRAEASGFARAFTQGMKDAYDVIRTGRSEMDVLYGKSTDNYVGEAEFGSKLLSFPGRVHGMIKVPVKRAAFERAVQRLADYYARQGLDVTDELVKTRIAVEAYKAGNRAIFLNNNFVADKVNAFLALKVDPTTGKPTVGSKVWATGGRVALPIIRVPVNIVAETMQYAGGLVSGNLRLANAFRKGIETLQPEQADLIMRELKKGSVGAAVLLLGYFNADKVGGYYQPGQKRDPRDVKAGNLRIFGVQIPSWLMHNPLLETLQVGATVRRVADSKLRKKDTESQGLVAGVGAAALGVTEQVPFVRDMADFEKLRNPYTRGQFAGEYVKGVVVPSAIQQAAQWTDPLDPRLQRKPTTLGQHIATGIPGLRQRVPTAPVKGRVAAVPQPVLDAVTIRP